MKRLFTFSLMALALLMATPTHAVRIKDIARIDGVRPNQLIGYGLRCNGNKLNMKLPAYGSAVE